MTKDISKSSWITGIIVCMIFLSFTFDACKKDGDTKGVVIVNDSLGNPSVGASVTLSQDTAINTTTGAKANVNVTQTTDGSGRAEFVFALEAYLNIKATKGVRVAKGFIRLKEHETVSQTVHF